MGRSVTRNIRSGAAEQAGIVQGEVIVIVVEYAHGVFNTYISYCNRHE
jgi:hypothetical protein